MDYTISLPSKPKVVSEKGNSGVYEIDGLYAGYGHTLGSSLRRVILSSLPGFAVTEVKIEGAPHEFSTLPGVKEDVVNIMLNLKRIRFKMHSDEPQKARISVKGAGTATAADIEASGQLEVLNPDQPIAELTSKDAKLDIEMTVEKGLGYVPREALRKDRVEAGTIVLDAVFTPVRRINYEVENMRVGDRTDYNRLRFHIETDGSISPREALEEAIATMIRHLKAIVGWREEEDEEGLAGAEKEAEELKKEAESAAREEFAGEKEEVSGAKEAAKIKIEELQLPQRVVKALSDAGIRTVGGLARKKEEDLLAIEGVGKKAVQEIRRVLGNFGLLLGNE